MARHVSPTLASQLRRLAVQASNGLPNDGELLRRFICDRDAAAFELLVWRHGPMVLGVCMRILRDAHRAEDAFQATFLTLVRKANSIGNRQALAGWLYQVAFRTAVRAYSIRRKLASRVKSLEQVPSAELCYTDGSVDSDWRPILDQEINRLPKKYCLPVVLCHMQGRTLAEAAALLGWPRGTVAVRLMRARKQLRHRLARRGVSLSVALAGVLGSRKTLSAALVRAAVQNVCAWAMGGATATGVISGSVLSLSKGVMRAMLLTKLKIGVGLLAATVLVGSGAGWVTHRVAASESAAAADEPLVASQTTETRTTTTTTTEDNASGKNETDERRKLLAMRLAQAEDLLRNAERRLDAMEKSSLQELIRLRVKVLEARDDVKRKEAQAQSPEDNERLRGARTELFLAEEELKRLERRRDRELGRAEQSVRSQTARIDQLRELVDNEEFPRVPSSDRRLGDLESKVDQILHELQQIRRTTKRSSDDPPEKERSWPSLPKN
jgi:RNA polymerase sigma factor (sigma-70 family)